MLSELLSFELCSAVVTELVQAERVCREREQYSGTESCVLFGNRDGPCVTED